MLAISSSGPRARQLLDATSLLAAQLQANWFVVHVRQPLTFHYRSPATKRQIPDVDLAYARKLGASVILETGDLEKTLVSFASKMNIDYFVAGRSLRPRITFTWKLPLAAQIQRKLPNLIVITV